MFIHSATIILKLQAKKKVLSRFGGIGRSCFMTACTTAVLNLNCHHQMSQQTNHCASNRSPVRL